MTTSTTSTMTSTTDNNKLRILALHGYTQSDTVFRAKLGSLRKGFKKELEFTFLRAPHEVPVYMSENGEKTNGYGWWFNSESLVFKATVPSRLSVGFSESVALVERTVLLHGNRFDGILGFSQGAAFAAILCAMQEKNLIRVKFDFAIIISGFKSLCAPHAIYYNERIHLPSLHVYGKSDKVIPKDMMEEVCEIFENKKVVTHDSGHYVPGRKDIYKDFIAEMLANKAAKN